jgi:hypothetical protein
MRADHLDEVTIESGIAEAFIAGVEERIVAGTEAGTLIAILGQVPSEVGFLYGRSYLSVPAAPIPSRFWPDKPDAGGSLTGHLIFGRPEGGGGVPPGTVGEAFWNFHVPGVLVVFFLWGRLANWLASFYKIHAAHGAITVLYVVTLLYFSPNTVSFYDWFHSMAAALLALILFCGFPRIRKRTTSVQVQKSGPESH